MLKGILRTDLFNCSHLGMTTDDEQDIMHFVIRREEGAGLLDYIQHHAFPEEDAGMMRTYLVRDNRSGELVAYFSLKAGLISLNEREIEYLDSETGDKAKRIVFDTLPGVELANFAVNDGYMDNHKNLKGVGTVVFNQFVLPLVRRSAEDIGIKILYIFALPREKLIARYKEDYGFSRLTDVYEDELHKRLKPFYDDTCIFMYMIL